MTDPAVDAREETLSPLLAGGAIATIGTVLSLVHAFHAVAHEKPVLATVIGAGLPLALSLALVYAGYWTARRPKPLPYVGRLTVWTVLGGIVFGLLLATITVHQYLAGSVPEDAVFQLATAVTGGSLGGFVVGLYDLRIQRRTDRIVALQRATADFGEAQTKTGVCRRIVQLVSSELDMSLAGVWLYREDRNALVPVEMTDRSEKLFDEYPTYEPGEGLSWQAFADGEPQIHDDLRSQRGVYNPETIIRSEIILPLGSHGVLTIGSRERNAFDDVDVSTAKLLASASSAVLDRTQREEQLRAKRRELETRNEHLNEFAAVVSHDLRNPLTVAQGHLELHREECESSSLDEIELAHQRMANLIDDLLELARAGQTIKQTRQVDLTAVASMAWEMVDSTAVRLEIPDEDVALEADEDRLRQLFENLFRNAIDHGGSTTTVRVGGLDGRRGFYVADDGRGVPPEDQERIFEHGYTTDEDGTGLGLVTVRRIVDAHGWSVSVAESDCGGARFEIETDSVGGENRSGQRSASVDGWNGAPHQP
ncbi:ATP-binding protein [Natrarchaeobius chitinivorans]|uniref:histidine kinase n=1 Tax=Natrarchaeobius chitinivorans TaxID=1679083 RepID=A0A3N6LZS3_NATCH|nr:ATP-binding protein [Natrarchaeobius chitinivorans]RQG96438.1 histidine kinase [Natrarchaeobius chitinivorans]